MPPWGMFLLGVAGTLWAILALLSVECVVIDRSEGRVESFTRTVRRSNVRTRPLGDVQAVSFELVVAAETSPPRLTYPVRLVMKNGAIDIAHCKLAEEASQLATQVAVFAGIPVMNLVGDELEEYEPQRLLGTRAGIIPADEGGRRVRMASPVRIAEMPEGCSLHVQPEGDAVVLRLPPEGWAWQRDTMIYFLVYFLPFCSMFTVVIPWALAFRMHRDYGFAMFFTVATVFAGMVVILRSLWLARTVDRVELHPTMLRVRRSRPLYRRSWTIRYESLEAVCRFPQARSMLASPQRELNCGLTLFDDHQACTFGRSMSLTEANWLSSTIDALSSVPASSDRLS